MTKLVSLDSLSLGLYDVTVLRFLEGSTEGTSEGNHDGFLPSAGLVSLDVLEIGTDDGNAIIV